MEITGVRVTYSTGGTVKNGQVVPDTPLPEGARVEVFVTTAVPQPTNSTSNGLLNSASNNAAPLNGHAANGHAGAASNPTLNSPAQPVGKNGQKPGNDLEGWSWEQAIAQAPVSEWQLAREAQAKAQAEAKLQQQQSSASRAASRFKIYMVLAVLSCIVIAAAVMNYQGRQTHAVVTPVKILKRTVKNRSVELTLGAKNNEVEGMRALGGELWNSPRAREVIVYYGKPNMLLIYDRQNKSLAAIPTAATDNLPCNSFVSGPSFSHVTDKIIHEVARTGGGINALSRFCGSPGKIDYSNCR